MIFENSSKEERFLHFQIPLIGKAFTEPRIQHVVSPIQKPPSRKKTVQKIMPHAIDGAFFCGDR